MSNPSEHFNTIDSLVSKIEREVNWMGLDGHLITPEQMEAVNEISLACQKARNTISKAEGAKEI